MRAQSASDSRLDRLYQAPLGDFVAERNALAKSAGAEGAGIRALQKPTVPAWAVNQLYWQRRPVYDELIERAEDLRATHNAALRGRRADLREASRSHEEAVESALKTTLGLLADGGHPVTDATRQSIATTLRGLPGDEPPGRLTRQLQPRGFEMLGGAASQGKVRVGPPAPATKPERQATRGKQAEKGGDRVSDKEKKERAARLASARDRAAAAARDVRLAEQAVRREEFESARAGRDADKALRRVAAAEDALEQAKAELADAERASAVLVKARDSGEAKAKRAAEELADARDREEKARLALEKLS
jgi:hypothetical protein